MHFISAKSILSSSSGINIYRGCSHGCIYCDSRSACYNMNHDFEDVEVKQNAPQLLEKALKSKRKRCMISTGSMSDPYLHAEETLQLTRQCLEVINRYGFGICILTKSTRILRDLDLLINIHKNARCVVQMTLTTYDEQLSKVLEPHVSTTKERIEALKIFKQHGIPTVVWLCPVLPWINDTHENIHSILEACKEAHVDAIVCFGMGLTLREGNREYFYQALDSHFPVLKEKYQNTYGTSYEVNSAHHYERMQYCRQFCADADILFGVDEVFAFLNQFPVHSEQLSLF